MKKILFASLILFTGQAYAQSQENYYSSTFQSTDYGSMDASGRSNEKAKTLQNNHESRSSSARPPSTVISTKESGGGSIRTKMYYWTDARGIKHYSDSASKAPKGAQSKILVTARPSYTPPVDTSTSFVSGPLEAPVQGQGGQLLPMPSSSPPPPPAPPAGTSSLPPTSMPPTSLPPIPPIP